MFICEDYIVEYNHKPFFVTGFIFGNNPKAYGKKKLDFFFPMVNSKLCLCKYITPCIISLLIHLTSSELSEPENKRTGYLNHQVALSH